MTYESTLQRLNQELTEAKESVRQLEEVNEELVSSVATYRCRWINECRAAVAQLDGDAGYSQAGWLASSPIRYLHQLETTVSTATTVMEDLLTICNQSLNRYRVAEELNHPLAYE